MTTEIKLPPLPELGEYITIWERILEWDNEPKAGTRALALSDKVDDEITATLQAYATAAIKAYRAQRGEPVAWRWVWKSKPDDIEGWCYTHTPPKHPEQQIIEALYTAPQPLELESFVNHVPDRCDRIIWRGNYYGLPITSQPERKHTEAEVQEILAKDRDTPGYFFEDVVRRILGVQKP